MRTVIAQMELTLDGFTAGPNGEFDWFTLDQEAWQARFDQFSTVDTVLLGRKNYQGFGSYWPAVATNPAASKTDIQFSHWLNEVAKVVFSNTLEATNWKNSRLAKDDLAKEVSELKERPGQDILIMSSASIARACMRYGLLDEYWLTVHPVAIGHGKPLFEDRIGLKLLNTKVYHSGQVFLHYATRRD